LVHSNWILKLVHSNWFTQIGSLSWFTLVHSNWFTQTGSPELVHSNWLAHIGSLKLIRSSWFTQIGSLKLVHSNWFTQLVHPYWFTQIGSLKLVYSNWFTHIRTMGELRKNGGYMPVGAQKAGLTCCPCGRRNPGEPGLPAPAAALDRTCALRGTQRALRNTCSWRVLAAARGAQPVGRFAVVGSTGYRIVGVPHHQCQAPGNVPGSTLHPVLPPRLHTPCTATHCSVIQPLTATTHLQSWPWSKWAPRTRSPHACYAMRLTHVLHPALPQQANECTHTCAGCAACAGAPPAPPRRLRAPRGQSRRRPPMDAIPRLCTASPRHPTPHPGPITFCATHDKSPVWRAAHDDEQRCSGRADIPSIPSPRGDSTAPCAPAHGGYARQRAAGKRSTIEETTDDDEYDSDI
jgi:hypothetical protein